jgi:hypothetical protein
MSKELEETTERVRMATERVIEDNEFLGALVLYMMQKHHYTQFGVLVEEVEELRKAKQIKVHRLNEKLTIFAEPKPTKFDEFVKERPRLEYLNMAVDITRAHAEQYLPAIDPHVV